MAIYVCGRCNKTFDDSNLQILPGLRCPYCGYKVIYMVRRQGIKVIKAV
ncbi:DNA-directed RNA polymerase subunit P [Sulfolobales archaeon HS-7]|nr:DNA-directed RNA polymerase subunit P [Sulfolobales archaeon HS-7]